MAKTINDVYLQLFHRLRDGGDPQPSMTARELTALACRADKNHTAGWAHAYLDDATVNYAGLLCDRVLGGEPLAYILGEWDFYGLTFRVDKSVLIPRADTEILVEKALKVMPPNARVLDIGTGSGAIAVSLARLGQAARVTAVDVSDKALEIARKNAENNGADVEFVKSDCFSALQGRKYDMIVSNPPYISDEEMQTLMPEVRQEPELALFGGGDGLDFYRRISREAPEHLNEGGFLLFEIGWLQKDAVSALMRTFIGEPFALRDYGRNWRVVGAQLKRR